VYTMTTGPFGVCATIGWTPSTRSTMDKRQWPSATWRCVHVPVSSGPRSAMVAVIASIVAFCSVRSFSKDTQPAMPHTATLLTS
jgi:hypothetical protein